MTQGSTPSGRRPKNLGGGAPRRADAHQPVRARDVPSSRAARSQREAAAGPGIDRRILVAAGLGVALLVIGIVLGGGFLGGSPIPTPGPGSSRATTAGCPTSQPPPLAAGETRTVTIQTAEGTIVIEVDGSLSPIATGNFVALASCGFYDGVVFHRLVPGFVIQGGDPNGDGRGGPGYTIRDEPITGTYHRGTVAMARTPGVADSQGSQFFIVLDDDAASSLTQTDPGQGYAILGEVTSGMDVVDTIAAMPNAGRDAGNAALDPVAMTSVSVSNP